MKKNSLSKYINSNKCKLFVLGGLLIILAIILYGVSNAHPCENPIKEKESFFTMDDNNDKYCNIWLQEKKFGFIDFDEKIIYIKDYDRKTDSEVEEKTLSLIKDEKIQFLQRGYVDVEMEIYSFERSKYSFGELYEYYSKYYNLLEEDIGIPRIRIDKINIVVYTDMFQKVEETKEVLRAIGIPKDAFFIIDYGFYPLPG